MRELTGSAETVILSYVVIQLCVGEVPLTLPLLLLLVGLSYVLVFGGLTLLRREALSLRFAIESVVITILAVALVVFAHIEITPLWLLLLLYLITMRARLLVDLGNPLARRGNLAAAERIYGWALRLWPDPASRLIVQINRGVLSLDQGQPDTAIEILQDVLRHAKSGYLGAKYECACHYNLAVAYTRKGLDAQAMLEFNAVLDTWPASEYARRASAALERRRTPEGP